MSTSSITSKGQITVPVKMRRELGLETGTHVRFVRKGRQVLIEAVVEPPLDSVFGVLKAPRGRGVADVDKALADSIGKRRKPATR